MLIGLLVMIGFEIVADKWKAKKWLIVPAVFGILSAAYIAMQYGILGVLNFIVTSSTMQAAII